MKETSEKEDLLLQGILDHATSKYENNKNEELLDSIFQIPDWIKNKTDLLKFIAHINLRLQQKIVQIRSLNKIMKEELGEKFESIEEKRYSDLVKDSDHIEKIYSENFLRYIDIMEKNFPTITCFIDR